VPTASSSSRAGTPKYSFDPVFGVIPSEVSDRWKESSKSESESESRNSSNSHSNSNTWRDSGSDSASSSTGHDREAAAAYGGAGAEDAGGGKQSNSTDTSSDKERTRQRLLREGVVLTSDINAKSSENGMSIGVRKKRSLPPVRYSEPPTPNTVINDS
jgi:hypothetical protein